MGMIFRRRQSSKIHSRRSSSPTIVPPDAMDETEQMRVAVRAKSICTSSNLDRLFLERQQSSLSSPSPTPVQKDPWSQESIEEAIGLWELDENQVARLLELKERLKDCAHHWKYDPHTVLRFMTSPQGAKAETMFRKMVQWRLENNIDSLLTEYKPPQLLLDHNISAILDNYDRDGDPIYFERGGMADAAGMMKHFTPEEVKDYLIYVREVNTRGEWLDDYEQRQGRKVRDVTIVYDLKGLNHNHLNPAVLKFFGEFQKINQDMYPGPVKRIIIIRAPAIFRYIYGVVKHFFPQSTRDKMIFAGKNHLRELEKYIELEHLPKCIYEHGHGVPTIGHPVHCEGGVIPDDAVRIPAAEASAVIPSPKKIAKSVSFESTELDSQSERSFNSQ